MAHLALGVPTFSAPSRPWRKERINKSTEIPNQELFHGWCMLVFNSWYWNYEANLDEPPSLMMNLLDTAIADLQAPRASSFLSRLSDLDNCRLVDWQPGVATATWYTNSSGWWLIPVLCDWFTFWHQEPTNSGDINNQFLSEEPRLYQTHWDVYHNPTFDQHAQGIMIMHDMSCRSFFPSFSFPAHSDIHIYMCTLAVYHTHTLYAWFSQKKPQNITFDMIN